MVQETVNEKIDTVLKKEAEVYISLLEPKVLKTESPIDISLKEAIINNLIVGPIALILYFALTYSGNFEILNSEYNFHAVLTFCCFAVLPLLYTAIFQLVTRRAKYLFLGTKKGLTPKKVISSLVQGVAMHAGIFYPWVVLAQKYVPDVRSLRLMYMFGFDTPLDWFINMSFIAINVMMFEIYSKAFIQLQFAEAKGSIRLFNDRIVIRGGKRLGFILQFLVWMGGHWLEMTWLPDYMGFTNALFFIIMSGLLTGYTVYKTENIFGVTLGHILLNVFIIAHFAS